MEKVDLINKTKMEQITGTIKSVNLIREGEKDGRKWQMFEVNINDQKFITFDWQYKNKIGQEGVWNYEEKEREGRDGRIHINKTLDNLPRPKPATQEALVALENRVRALEDKVFGIKKNDEYDDEYKIDDEDLPF